MLWLIHSREPRGERKVEPLTTWFVDLRDGREERVSRCGGAAACDFNVGAVGVELNLGKVLKKAKQVSWWPFSRRANGDVG